MTSPFVGVHVVYQPNQHYAELAAYAYYLGKEEKGAKYFTRDGVVADVPAFLLRV